MLSDAVNRHIELYQSMGFKVQGPGIHAPQFRCLR